MAENTLSIIIKGDSSSAQAAVQQLRQSITSEVQKIQQVFQSSTAQATNFGTQLKSALSGGSGGFGGGSAAVTAFTGATTLAVAGLGALIAVGTVAVSVLLDIANSASAYASKIQDAHEQTTFTVESLQLLQAVGIANGVTFDQIVNSISQFQDRLAQATEGNKKLRTEFKNLGLDIETAANQPEKAFFQLLTTLANVENAVERTALAKDLLGKSGVRLLRILGDLTTGGQDFKKELQDIGVILRGSDIAALDEFGDTWDRIKLTAQGAINLIAKEFIPTLIVGLVDTNSELKSMKDIWPKIGIAANEFFREVILGLKEAQFETTKLATGLGKVFIPDFNLKTVDEVLQKQKEGIALIKQGLEGNEADIAAAFDKKVADLKARLVKEEEEEAKSQGKRRGLLANHNAKQKAEHDKAADNAIRAIERENREVDRIYNDTLQRLKRNFDQRLESEQSLTAGIVLETEIRRTLLTDALNQEADIVKTSKLSKTTKDDRLDKITQQLIEVNRQADKEIEDARFQSNQRILRANIELERERLDTARAADRARLDAIRAAIDAEVIERATGEERISAVILAEIDRRIAAQEKEIARNLVNAEQKAIEEEKLKALLAERSAAEADGIRIVAAARNKDLAGERAAISELRQIYQSARQSRIDLAATFSGNQISVIQQNAELQKKAIEDQFKLEQVLARQQLDDLTKAAQQKDADQDQIVVKQVEINNRLVALEQEKNDRIALINRQAKVATQTADPLSTRNLVGDGAADAVDKISDKLSKTDTLTKSFGASFAATLNKMAAQSQAPLKTIGALAGAMGVNFALSGVAALAAGQSIGSALRATVQATLASVAQIAGVEALKNVGYALNAMGWTIFTGDPKGAAAASQYWAAAAAWGALAIGTAVGAGALSGSGGAGASGSAGSSLTGTRQDQNTISTEERFRFRESGAGRPVTTIILVTDQAQQIKNVETSLGISYSNDGTAKKIIDHATSGRPF